MSATHRERSADEWEGKNNGPSKFPKKKSVCQSVNYWRHKHYIDSSIRKEIHNMEDDLGIMDSETSNLIKSLQNECSSLLMQTRRVMKH